MLRGAEFWQPGVPAEPGPVGPIGAPASGTVTVMINFDHELEDRSGKRNHALFEFTNAQLVFADGQNQDLSFAVNFNPNSNSTYDKLWIPFSPTTQIVYDTPVGFSIFTRIMPLLTNDVGGADSPPPPPGPGPSPPPPPPPPSGPPPRTNRIVYFGGPVFNRRKIAIYNIFWGSGWNDTSGETWWHYTQGSGQNVNGPSVRSATITGMQQVADSEYWNGYWSYGGQPGITIGSNITNTTTPYPMSPGQNLPLTLGQGAEAVILAERDAGRIPNWDSFGEIMTDKNGVAITQGSLAGAILDYTHIIVVHLDPRHLSIANSAGYSWKSYTPGPPPGTVYYAYCALQFTAPEQLTDFTLAQHQIATWTHELTHQIGEGPGFSTCTQNVTGFNYRFGNVCTWPSHIGLGPNDGANCPQTVRNISGTQALVPRYYSDIDGGCIAPGTGEAWIRPFSSPTLGPQAATEDVRDDVQYYGGPTMNRVRPQVWLIFWGSEWNSGALLTMKNNCIADAQAISASDYFGGLWSYKGDQGLGVQKPVYGGAVTNTTYSTGTPSDPLNLQAADISPLIRHSMIDGLVPRSDNFMGPTVGNIARHDFNHIYAVFLKPGMCVAGAGGGDIGQSGFHARSTTGTSLGFTADASFTWVAVVHRSTTPPLPSMPSADWRRYMMSTWAHEVIGSLTTPQGGTPPVQGSHGHRFRSSGFTVIPDNAPTKNLTISGVMVQQYWSDLDGKLLAPGTGDIWTAPEAGPTGPLIRRYIFQKLDDLDNGATAAIGSSGTVFFNVKKAGVEYKVKSAGGVVRPNEWADCWFVFDSATNTPAIYINNAKYTDPSNEPLVWNNTHSHTILGNYNMGATVGQYRGRMDDFRLYRSALVEDAQIDNFAANSLTITPIEMTPEQGVFIVNRVKIDKQLENSNVFVPADVQSGDVPGATSSFTTTSFTNTSFTL